MKRWPAKVVKLWWGWLGRSWLAVDGVRRGEEGVGWGLALGGVGMVDCVDSFCFIVVLGKPCRKFN